jgi:pyridoxine 5-phosphate synthase
MAAKKTAKKSTDKGVDRQGGVRLSVNVDHVATLRQARRGRLPDPVEAARIAEDAGASGITVHLRMDRRHIQDSDVERLRGSVRGKLNLEMSIAEEMVKTALRIKPDQVTLVPERPEEVTTEGGLNLVFYGRRIGEVVERLAEAGIGVSLFLDPETRQVEAAATLAPRGVQGFEINTDAYTRAPGGLATDQELAKINEVAELGRSQGLRLFAGHGLTVDNVGPIAAVAGMEELNIGYSIIARSVMVGIEAAVREMLAAIAAR